MFTDSQLNVIRRINADGTVQTITGQGIPGFGGDGGPAANALLNVPCFPAYDANGNLYFADLGNFRIRRIDPSGVISTVAGTGIPANTMTGPLGANGPATQTQMWTVTGLVVDSAGNVYFTDRSLLPDVRRVTPLGDTEVYVVCSQCAPSTGLLLAADSSGDLYLSDGSHIFKVTPDRVFHNFCGFGSAADNGNGGPAINAPPSNFIGLVADAAGDIYTEEEQVSAEAGSQFVIRKIGTDGNINVVAGTFTGGSYSDGPALQEALVPDYGFGLFAEPNGTILFAEDFRVRELTASSDVQTLAGAAPLPSPSGTPALDAWFIQPNAITFDQQGNLYVAQACVIQEVSPGGVLSTVAGTGVCANTTALGPALQAQLDDVISVAVDSHGQIYFSEPGGFIYVVSTAGTISQAARIDGAVALLLAIDSQDRLYFLDYLGMSGRIPPGAPVQYINEFEGSANGYGIAIDGADNVYLCCDTLGAIDEYSPNLEKTELNAVGRYTSLGQNMLAVDTTGTIWQGSVVTGYPGFQMQKGGLSFGAGCCFYGDGGAAESAYILPSGMAFAPNGDLYFLDPYAARVRRIHGSPPTTPPAISAGGIVNAASLTGTAIAPGELISIFGSNFGPPGLDVAAPQNNMIPDALNNVHVYFGSPHLEGRITARTANQINVFVPYEVAGATSIQVTVDVDSVTSQPVTMPIAASAFGISTADGSGTGQGAILNQNGGYNSASNPAASGSIVTLFGTGEGVTAPALPDGALEISTPYSTPALPVTVKFGDETAQVQYAGAAPFLPTGVFQIDATIPTGIAPGDIPVTVLIGGISTTQTVTVAVK